MFSVNKQLKQYGISFDEIEKFVLSKLYIKPQRTFEEELIIQNKAEKIIAVYIENKASSLEAILIDAYRKLGDRIYYYLSIMKTAYSVYGLIASDADFEKWMIQKLPEV